MLDLAFRNIRQTVTKLPKYALDSEESAQLDALQAALQAFISSDSSRPLAVPLPGIELLNCLLMESGLGEDRRWPTSILFAAGSAVRHALLDRGVRDYYTTGDGASAFEVYLAAIREVVNGGSDKPELKVCAMMNIAAILNLFVDYPAERSLEGSPLLPFLADIAQAGASASALEIRKVGVKLLANLALAIPADTAEDHVVSVLCCLLERFHSEEHAGCAVVLVEATVRLLRRPDSGDLRELAQTLGYTGVPACKDVPRTKDLVALQAMLQPA